MTSRLVEAINGCWMGGQKSTQKWEGRSGWVDGTAWEGDGAVAQLCPPPIHMLKP